MALCWTESGAVVPAATVVLQDTLNKTERTVSSNGSGAFTFAGIPSGNYQLTVTKAGFTEAVRTGIHLDPGDSRTITDLRLAVGSAPTTVNVSSVASIDPADHRATQLDHFCDRSHSPFD